MWVKYWTGERRVSIVPRVVDVDRGVEVFDGELLGDMGVLLFI